MIAGGLPQNLTYEEDTRSEEEITKDFKEQAGILNPYVDFFILMFGAVLRNLNAG